MNNVDYKKELILLYKESEDISKIDLSDDERKYIDIILNRISSNRGVYTVLITLAMYKIYNPSQDIRYHQTALKNGFSGRSFDTQFITPTLKELGLPAMAESGWLTRSLEQAYPYDFEYNGKITPIELKDAFLNTIHNIQKSSDNAKIILKYLLNGGIQFQEINKIKITKINSDEIEIDLIINLLKSHFEKDYGTHGGAKLPVIAFYAIYSVLMNELIRFNNCTLAQLGSHTASDRTSKSGGDIEVFKNGDLFEALEIKLNKKPTAHMVRVAYEKINKFGISRYYILSALYPNESELNEINILRDEIQNQHGCQLIVNGLYPSLKYYLRLISNANLFLNKYIDLVESDSELKIVHKNELKLLLNNLFPNNL